MWKRKKKRKRKKNHFQHYLDLSAAIEDFIHTLRLYLLKHPLRLFSPFPLHSWKITTSTESLRIYDAIQQNPFSGTFTADPRISYRENVPELHEKPDFYPASYPIPSRYYGYYSAPRYSSGVGGYSAYSHGFSPRGYRGQSPLSPRESRGQTPAG